MSIEGRIIVDALFHDKAGTASLKVVSMSRSQAIASGKVAYVTGTCGTNAVTIQLAPTTYRDASGATVSFSELNSVIVQAAGSRLVLTNPTVSVAEDRLAVIHEDIADFEDSGQLPTVRAASGTASFAITFVGS
jgi:hypothetical protein